MTDVAAGFECSPQQRRLWALGPGAAALRAQCAVEVHGQLRAADVERALRRAVARHEILRTSLRPAVGLAAPVQEIAARAAFRFVSRRAAEGETVASVVDAAFDGAGWEADGTTAGDGTEVAPLAAELIGLADDRHLLVLRLPAACGDDATLERLVAEAVAGVAVDEVAEGEEPLQYADLAAWQNGLLVSEETAAGRERWRSLDLAAELAAPPLPGMRAPAAGAGRGSAVHCQPGRVRCRLAANTVERLRDVAPAGDLGALLLAAWAALLARLGGRREIVVGVDFDGRHHAALEGALGPLAHCLPIRLVATDVSSLRELAGGAAAALAAAADDQELFSWPRGGVTEADGAPFLPFGFDPAGARRRGAGSDGTGSRCTLLERYAFVDLHAVKLGASGTAHSLELWLDHDRARFGGDEALRLLQRLGALLGEAAATPDRALRELDVVLPGERQRLLAAGDSAHAYPRDRCMHELFAARAAATPGALAAVAGDSRLTYRELDRRSDELACHLQGMGIGTGTVVGVLLPRSLEQLVAVLAILKAGGAFLPLDPALPVVRLAAMVEEARPRVVLSVGDLAVRLEAAGAAARVLRLDALGPLGRSRSAAWHRPVRRARPEDLAYVLFTSGSTGRPKGTLVAHRPLVNYLTWAAEAYGLGPGAGAPHHTSLCFDLTLTALLAPLVAGGWVDVLPEGSGVEPLVEALRRRPGYAMVKLTPSHLRLLALALDEDERRAAGAALVLGGESLLAADLEPWWNASRGTRRISNEYGPTEAVVGCTASTLTSPLEPAAGEVPIGRPVANARVYLVDAGLRLVPPGVTGEVLVGGEGLARGYLGQPRLTAERFLPDPFSATGGGRVYRTGDLGRRPADGELEFLGRRDDQVKIRGFRVEPGEVAALLAAHPAVRAAAVVARDDAGGGGRRLIGYVVAADGAPLDEEALRRHLAERLPEPMLPAALVELPRLPLGPSGKLDRAALPAPEEVVAPAADAPRGALEEVVAAIWADVLGRQRVGAHEDFFRLGGESMRAAQLVFRLSRALEVELPVQALFESPTVHGLAARITALRGESATDTAAVPPLRAHDGDEPDREPPLSFAQERLWILDQLEPGSTAFHVPVALRLTGELDAEALEGALAEVVRRHAPLRAAFDSRDGRPRQRLREVSDPILRRVDLRALPEPARAEALDRLLRDETALPFDLSGRSGMALVRGLLVAMAPGEHVVALTLHHVASDGWSSGILVREAAALYAAFAAGRRSPLPPLPIAYGDFAAWQRQWLAGGAMASQLAYWRRQLAGVPPLELPGDRPRPAAQSYRGRHLPFALSPATTRALAALGRQHGASLFMVLLAAFEVLLLRHSGQRDFVVGVPVAGRTRRELEDLIGCFVNTLALRADLGGDPTFAELLARVRRTALAAYAHQDVPFERLLDELGVERDRSRSPLFQVGFTLENVPVAALELPALEATPLPLESGTAKYDLSLLLAEEPDGLRGTLEYAVDLFDAPTMRRLLAHYATLLEAVAVGAAVLPVSRLPLLVGGERFALVHEWCESGAPWADAAAAGPPSLHEAFVRRAGATPSAVALLHGERRWSYGELRDVVSRLAAELAAAGVGREVVVGLCLERSPQLVAATLAVLAAGGAFLPLDPELPAERLAFMVADSGARVLVTREALRERLPAAGAMVLTVDGFATGAGAGSGGEADARAAAGDGEAAADAEAAAYVIYTSGSTGRPKGVVVRHGGLANLLVAQSLAFAIGPGDRVLQFASPSFDAAVWELGMALSSGATLVLADRETLADGAALDTLLDAAAVTVATLPPTMLALLVADGGAHPTLRLLISAGEACGADLVRRWAAPTRRVVNAYGPTETTVCATLATCEPGSAPPPIGRPLHGARVHLLDGALEPVPLGVAGEIFVAGAPLARGYLGRPRATAERFLPDPFSAVAGGRLYATGDRARRLTDGSLQYRGRGDQQVKVRGHRVEPGEVEAALRRHSSVRDAVVVQRTLRGGAEPGERAALVAYVVAADGGGERRPTVAELRGHLAASLPEALIPARFVVLAALPLTSTGKVDRRALPDPGEVDAREPADEAEVAAPRTPLEERLAAIWAAVLGLERVAPAGNFFALGGDSILAIQVASRAQRAGLGVQARHLFEHQTVAELACALEDAVAADGGVTAPDAAGTTVARDAAAPAAARTIVCQAVPGVVAPPASATARVAASADPPLASTAPTVASTAAPDGEEGAAPATTDEVPLVPIQRWFFDLAVADLQHWNQAVLLDVRRPLGAAVLTAALRALVARHEALRLRFTRTAAGTGASAWRQWLLAASAVDAPLEVVDLGGLTSEAQRREVERVAAGRQASLDLEHGPLLAAVLFRRGSDAGDRLLLVAHHLIVDAVSWRILLEELALAAEQAAAREAIDLGPAPPGFAAWAAALAAASAAPGVRSATTAPQAAGEMLPPLPVDHGGGLDDVGSRHHVTRELDAERSRLLLANARGNGSPGRNRVEVMVLAALAAALRRWTGASAHRVDVESHGRVPVAGVDPSRTVGWLTALHRVTLRCEEGWSAAGALAAVEKSMAAAVAPGPGAWQPPANASPRAEISFNYLGRLDRALDDSGPFAVVANAELGPTASPRSARPHLLEVEAMVRDGLLELGWAYSENRHRAATIEALAASCLRELAALVDGASPRAGKTAIAAADSAPAAGIEAVFPLSPMQEGMLFHSLRSPGAGAYVGQVSCLVPGTVDGEVLEAAWSALTRRHQALRTALSWEGHERPLQMVRRDVPAAFERHDWRAIAVEQEEERLQALLVGERRRGFDLACAPLLRVAWIALADDAGGPRHRLVLTLHHVVVDGWSMSVLLSELFELYRQLAGGREPELPAAPAFADYVAWLEEGDRDAAAAFWRRYLAGFRAPTPLGLERRAPAAAALAADGEPRDYRAERLVVDPESTAALHAFARRQRLTLNTLVQGALALLLRRYGGEDDVVFGVTTAGRPAELPDVERAVGLFLNTLPLRVRVERQRDLAEWLRALQAGQAEVRRFETTPLVEIQERSELPRGTPLFEALLVFENYPLETALGTGDGAPFAVADVRTSDETHYPLTVVAVPGESLGLGLYYDARELAPPAVRRMLDHLVALLRELAAGEGRRLGELPLLPAAEWQLLDEWSVPPSAPPRAAAEPVPVRFARWAAERPDAAAVSWEGGSVTYGELARAAGALAARLRRSTGATEEPRIGVCLERSPEMVAAVLAVLAAGAAYVPLDPEYPAQRLAYMVEDAGLAVILTRSALRGRLPATANLLFLDDGGDGAGDAGTAAPSSPGSHDLAYVIYTSGSTGRPKGVLVEHGGLANVIAHAAAVLAVGPGSRVLQAASLSFDASALEIFTALTSGAALCLVGAETLRDGERLGAALRRQRVSTLIAVPSLLRLLAPETLPEVVAVMAGGEPCPAELAARWQPGRRVYNAYAPTETTIYSTLERCDGSTERAPGVGRPIAGMRLHLLDDALEPVPVGASGELLVGGVGVARGYHRRPALTAARFLPDPFGGEPGGRLYRTGDRGRWREDGTLELQGRRDEQVKLRGFRVELGEVAAALVEHPAVRDAVAMVRQEPEDGGQGRLVAYAAIEPAARTPELDAELRAHLRQRLPEHMLPAAIAQLESLPRLPSGKVDRRALPAPEALPRGGARSSARPRTATEREVAAIWSEVLKLAPDAVGIDDNFFDLGGQSLLAIQVQSRLGERLGRRVAIVELFRHPTVRALARHLEADGEVAGVPTAPAADRTPRRSPAAHDEQRRRRAGARRASDAGEPTP